MSTPGSKAQSSVELIVILSLVLTVFGILFMISQDNYNAYQRNVKSLQARSALKDITNTADFIYSQGEGVKSRAYVTIPQGVNETIEVSGDHIIMRLNLGGRIQDIIESSDACLTGDIPEEAGSYWITLEYVGSCVRIGEASLTVNPTSLNFEVYAENPAESQNISISNLESNLTDIALTIIGSTIQGWVTLNPDTITISGQGSENSIVSVNPPAGTDGGYYYGQIRVSNSKTFYVDLSIRILRNSSLVISPSSWTTALSRSESETKGVSICNTGEQTLYSAGLSTTGSGNWITFSGGTSLGDISPGACVYRDSILTVPGDAGFGINSGDITASDGASDTATVSVNVIVASCSDYCEFNGYDNGTCRQNEAQCTVNGETYESGGDTY